MGRIFVIVALLLIGTAAFLTAFFPHVLPRLTNSYYSLIRMKTRVVEEDYTTIGVRLSGAAILIVEVIWFCYRLSLGKK